MAMLLLSGPAFAGKAPRPMAEVWPYQVKTLPDGALEYSYDLLPARKAKGTPDAIAAHGEEKVLAYLKELPGTVKVRVAAGAPWTISAGRGPEARTLTTAFALVSDGPMLSDAALPKDPLAKLRPALHPEVPRVLVGAAAVFWLVRRLEDGVVAAAELETEPARSALFARLLDKALARAKTAEGDAREGAQALAARLGAAAACLDPARIPAPAKGDAVVAKLTGQEITRLSGRPDVVAVPSPWTWSADLTCAYLRQRALAEPYEVTRAGTVAALLLPELLAVDPKLLASMDKLKLRRDRLLGAPVRDRNQAWLAAAKGKPEEAAAALSEFLEPLSQAERTPPGPWALHATPFRTFLDGLSPQERASEVDELLSAAQDGRLTQALAAEDWPSSRDATLAALAASDGEKSAQLDGAWREQLLADVAMLVGAHHEARAGARDLEVDDEERAALGVRLMVPPALEVEPAPLAYARARLALERLGKALADEKLLGLAALGPDGRRSPEPAAAEAKRLAVVLGGLARLSTPVRAPGGDDEVAAARRFLAAWRNDPRLSADVRFATASLVSDQGKRTHAATVGLSRRELVVGFGAKPKVELVGEGKGFELFTEAEQRYVVPVAVTVQGTAPAARRPLDAKALKAAVDAAGRDPAKIDGTFTEALAK